jgi:hypothetical protein
MVAVLVTLVAGTAAADTLVLTDGSVLQGSFRSGTASMLAFEVDGEIREVAVSDVVTLTFSPRDSGSASAATGAAAGAAVAAAAATPAAPSITGPVELPAGTKLMVKTTEAVSTASHQAGSKFKAELESAVQLNGAVVLPKGAVVYGTVLESIGGRRVGNQRIVVTFDGVKVGEAVVPIRTDDVGAEGGRGGAARAVGAGALIGAAADGGEGAAKGAAIGGAVALLAGGKHIQVPSGSLVEVALTAPVTIEGGGN